MKYPLMAYCCYEGVCVLYDVLLDGQIVGIADVVVVGLYYKVTCVCQLPKDCLYRLFLNDGITTVKLGVCVPDGDKFQLSTKVPKKHLPGDKWCFYVEGNCAREYPVSSGDTFSFLDNLENARLRITDGHYKVVINSLQDQ